jgi:hypothetical protein
LAGATTSRIAQAVEWIDLPAIGSMRSHRPRRSLLRQRRLSACLAFIAEKTEIAHERRRRPCGKGFFGLAVGASSGIGLSAGHSLELAPGLERRKDLALRPGP